MKHVPLKSPGLSLVIVGILVARGSMAGENEKPPSKGEKAVSVEMTAIVVRYEPDAMQDTFEDGGFASYDATELRILSPEDRRGKLVVFHSKPADDDSPWKAIGATIGFRLKAELLESKNRQIFTGAVEGLKAIKKPGDGRRVPRQPPETAALQRRAGPPAIARKRAVRGPRNS
jgi:hypothetical protein